MHPFKNSSFRNIKFMLAAFKPYIIFAAKIKWKPCTEGLPQNRDQNSVVLGLVLLWLYYCGRVSNVASQDKPANLIWKQLISPQQKRY